MDIQATQAYSYTLHNKIVNYAGLVFEDPEISTEFTIHFYKVEISSIWTTPGPDDGREYTFPRQTFDLTGVLNEPTIITYTNYINTSNPGDVKIVTEFSDYSVDKFAVDDSVANELALVFTSTTDCTQVSCSSILTFTVHRKISLWETAGDTKVLDLPDFDLSMTINIVDCSQEFTFGPGPRI